MEESADFSELAKICEVVAELPYTARRTIARWSVSTATTVAVVAAADGLSAETAGGVIAAAFPLSVVSGPVLAPVDAEAPYGTGSAAVDAVVVALVASVFAAVAAGVSASAAAPFALA